MTEKKEGKKNIFRQGQIKLPTTSLHHVLHVEINNWMNHPTKK